MNEVAGAFCIWEVDILCAKVHDARGVWKAGEMVEEEVACDAGDVEILQEARSSEKVRRTVSGSSNAVSAFCTGSWKTSGVMEVACSRQACTRS